MNISVIGNRYNTNYTVDNKTASHSNDENDFANLLSSKERLHNKIEEMRTNIEAGKVDFDPVFQIGGKAYTQEEWEKLLKYVDEVEEETQEAIEAEQTMKESDEATKSEKK